MGRICYQLGASRWQAIARLSSMNTGDYGGYIFEKLLTQSLEERSDGTPSEASKQINETRLTP